MYKQQPVQKVTKLQSCKVTISTIQIATTKSIQIALQTLKVLLLDQATLSILQVTMTIPHQATLSTLQVTMTLLHQATLLTLQATTAKLQKVVPMTIIMKGSKCCLQRKAKSQEKTYQRYTFTWTKPSIIEGRLLKPSTNHLILQKNSSQNFPPWMITERYACLYLKGVNFDYYAFPWKASNWPCLTLKFPPRHHNFQGFS